MFKPGIHLAGGTSDDWIYNITGKMFKECNPLWTRSNVNEMMIPLTVFNSK